MFSWRGIRQKFKQSMWKVKKYTFRHFDFSKCKAKPFHFSTFHFSTFRNWFCILSAWSLAAHLSYPESHPLSSFQCIKNTFEKTRKKPQYSKTLWGGPLEEIWKIGNRSCGRNKGCLVHSRAKEEFTTVALCSWCAVRFWFWGEFFQALPRPPALTSFLQRERVALGTLFFPPPVLRLSGDAGEVLGDFARDNLLKFKAEWEYVPAPSNVVGKSMLSFFAGPQAAPKNFKSCWRQETWIA